jgi:hypothetical protein
MIAEIIQMNEIAHILDVKVINFNVINMNGIQFLALQNIKDVIIFQIVQMVQMKKIVLPKMSPVQLQMVQSFNALMVDNVFHLHENVMEFMTAEIYQMKKIHVAIIIPHAFNINLDVQILHNVFLEHGIVMDQKIVPMEVMNLLHVNLNHVRVENFNVKIKDAFHENFDVIALMIVGTTLMKQIVANINVHQICGHAQILVTVFLSNIFVMENLTAVMGQMKKLAPIIFAHHLAVKLVAVHQQLVECVHALQDISLMKDLNELVRMSMNVPNGDIVISSVKIIALVLLVHVWEIVSNYK